MKSILLICLLCTVPSHWAFSFNLKVQLKGSLDVYSDSQMLQTNNNQYKVRFSIEEGDSGMFSIQGEVPADSSFRWIVPGVLLQERSVKVKVFSVSRGYYIWEAPVIEITPRQSVYGPIRPVLKSAKRAAEDAFANGNMYISKISPLKADDAKSGDLAKALYWYDKALEYSGDPTYQHEKASALLQVKNFEACTEAYDDLQNLLLFRKDAALEVKAWEGKISCLIGNAQNSRKIQDWWLVTNECRRTLDRFAGRQRVFGYWLDSLLAICGLTGSRADFRQFAKEIIKDKNLQDDWLLLFYTYFKRMNLPPRIEETQVFQCVKELSRFLGR